jgi:putative Mn2+ efflux pump MntP
MDIINLIIIGAVVGANNFAVAIALGMQKEKVNVKRVVTVFVLFETFIPLIGGLIGLSFMDVLGLPGNIIGGSLLIALGLLSFKSIFKSEDEGSLLSKIANSWKGLILLAFGLSLDNLIVGFSLALNKAHPLILSATIGVFSFIFINVGIKMGQKSKKQWGEYSKILTAFLLIIIGIANILDYL